jgi:Cu+-exporting ATPase
VVGDDKEARRATSKTPATFVVPVGGMTCAACSSRIEKALAKTPGVLGVEVSLARNTAAITVAEPERDIAVALEAILDAGYEPTATVAQILARHTAIAAAEAAKGERRAVTRNAAIALVIACAQMAIAMPLMGHGAHAGHDAHATLRWVLLGTTLPVVWIARSFFVRAWSALRHGTADMNTLVALGSGTAIAYSVAATLAPSLFSTDGAPPDVHFEAASFILAFVLLGRALEGRARARTTAALDALLALAPAVATVVRDGLEVRLTAAEVRPGDEVVLRPGDRAPVDGIVLTGESRVDESMLTGESRRLAKRTGDPVHAGTLNGDGLLHVRATRTGDDTQLARIADLVEHAQATRAPVQRLADRVAAVFAPIIVVVALVTAAAWAVFGPEPRLIYALTSFVAVVVVSCPCAMGLATPTALATALGRGAELGVLIRSGEALERAAEIDTVAIDKTGTLTTGEPSVVSIAVVGENDEAVVLRYAGAAEHGSEHPVARAVCKLARERNVETPPADSFIATPGAGVHARVLGRDVRVGALAWLATEGIDIALATDGASFGIALDGVLVATALVTDRLRDEARDVVARLQRMGLRVVVLSGDSSVVVRAVGQTAGADETHGDLSPEDKLRALEGLARAGRKVAMCGDGINDAPALARAHVGIAIGGGTDAAVDASDVTLLSGGLARLPDAVLLARRTMRVVRQNLGWAFAYNLVLVPVAAGALYPSFGVRLPPVLASVAMALSSVSVVLSSLRLRHFAKRGPAPPGGGG